MNENQIEFEDNTYTAVEDSSSTCTKCSFRDRPCYMAILECRRTERDDKRDIYWAQINE